MIAYAAYFATVCFGLGLVFTLYRIVRSPGVSDRILALDTMVINIIALIMLFGLIKGTGIFFEASILIAMVGFVSTVAYCRYLLRGDIIE